ncbi:MAG: methylmalonyl-CoA mutase subunit beta [Bacteroidales bacterium]|jgi:methylmalonyl-CoA mutase|nr:methylmalonyl-CoA mutase subunit beta [Bacteroidales bacterium]
MSDSKLFQDFLPVSTEEWENLINKDLKGADYERKLVWKTDEGFKVKPYYRAEDLESIDYLNTLPDDYPFTRGDKKENNNWEVVQEVNDSDPETANKIAADVLKKGATMITFNAKEIDNAEKMSTLLTGIDLTKFGVRFSHAKDYEKLTALFVEFVTGKGLDVKTIRGGIDFAPIVYFLKKNKFYISQEGDLAQLVNIYNMTMDMPNFKIVNVNGLAIHNAGATIVQELGYALGIANEYLAYATGRNIPVDQFAPRMEMTLSIGSNYFMEIAKLRAIRLLWATMVEQYAPQCDCHTTLYVNSVASSWNKTLYDPYVNMLRATTEGMSAAIGGTDAMTLKPFDTAYKEDDDFSRRITRNVQIILKEESFFDKVVDPAAGSYYIESMTDAIAEHAWALFQHIETEGGMIVLIKKGEVKAEVEKSCQKRDMDMATRRSILLGTNQYPNINESMQDKIEKYMDLEDDSPGLKTYRGAMAFEKLRLATEEYAKSNGRPKVFLFKIGNVNFRQARAGFVTNFFGCAGYEIVDNAGFNTVDEGIDAALKAGANLIVICSSDEEYGTLGVEIANKITSTYDTKVVVAGNPVDFIDTLRNAGVYDFIHMKTNVLESLKGYNDLLL